MNWDDLRLLLAVAQHSSLLEAARTLGLATTTVSRRIASLENAMGSQLIGRTHAGSSLTSTGQRLVDALTPLAATLAASVRASTSVDSELAGSVKVTVMEGLVPLTLLAIESFRKLYPAVAFEIDASPRNLDMSKHEADIALRIVQPRAEGLVLRRVGTIHFGVYVAAGQMLPGAPRTLSEQLIRSEAVVLGGTGATLRESIWLRGLTRGVSLETESLATLIDAVRRGIGVGVIPDELVKGDASLLRVGDCAAVAHKPLWLVMHRHAVKQARVRLFADHISSVLREVAAR